MNVISTSYGKQLKAELYSLSRYAFQNKCYEILQELFPFLVNAHELGDVDRMGVDIYSIAENGDQFDLAFQCKGNEVDEFEQRHLKDCLKSIESFSRSGKCTSCFYIIINKYIKNRNLRAVIQTNLQKLVTSGKATKAELLDINDFVIFIFNKTRNLLQSRIQLSNKRFLDDYRQSLDQSFYQEGVPFIMLSNPSEECDNPIKFTLESTLSYTAAAQQTSDGRIYDYGKNKWVFVISEFGFGKTSLLLNITSKLFDNGIVPIYLPIAQFEKESFSNEYSLCNKILEIIIEERLDNSRYLDKILLKDFQLLLRSTGKYALMFDGLDEHFIAYENNGLKQIFQCIQNFTNKCIFSVRKEFWDERINTLEEAIGPKKINMDFLMLKEWRDPDISLFLKTYSQQNALNSTSLSYLSEFEDMISSGDYHKYYGDIPKRPFFLKMLADDVSRGVFKKQNLSQLYENYLINKLKCDRNTSVSKSLSGRPLTIKGDIYKQAKDIFEILSYAAIRMGDNSVLTENNLKKTIKSLDIPVAETIEILLNSVLVPFGRRTLYDLQVKFAHKSFQDYFKAYYLLLGLLEPPPGYQGFHLYNEYCSKEVLTFLVGMIENLTIDQEKYKICISTLETLYGYRGPSNCLIRELGKIVLGHEYVYNPPN